jgi:hypothetical protein
LRTLPRFPLGLLAPRLVLLASVCLFVSVASAADVALAIVYDTSGSMRQAITATSGRAEPKYVIGNRALDTVATRLETFTASGKSLDLGVVVFRGKEADTALPLARFDAPAFRTWLHGQTAPDGATPLGEALAAAGHMLLDAAAPHRHLLIVTDGANTAGIAPVAALRRLQDAALRRETPVFVHIIALDIAPRTFAALQQQGATLIGAADEKQLGAQLDFILENKILLEAL